MFEDGNETIASKKSIDNYHFIDDDYIDTPVPEELIDHLAEISQTPIFANGMKTLCRKHGYNGDESNLSYRKFILEQALNNGIINEKGRKSFDASLSNWLDEGGLKKRGNKTETKNAPGDTIDSRLNVYKFCFALSMTLDEINEFFLKKYLCRPFNLRTLEETVYFYGLKQGKTYNEMDNLINLIKHHMENDNEEQTSVVYTSTFRHGLESIADDKEFIEYCITNKNYFSKNSQTAVDILNKLIESSYNMYVRFYNGYEQWFDDNFDKSFEKEEKRQEHLVKIAPLLYGIFGDYSQDLNGDDKTPGKESKPYERLGSNENIPQRIRTNLPSPQQISNIRNGKKVSTDALRKTIILFDFYDYFMKSAEEDLDTNEKYEDFLYELDNLLDSCGYVQSYARNPYDWLFMYCAKQEDPIFTFQLIIEKYVEADLSNDF